MRWIDASASNSPVLQRSMYGERGKHDKKISSGTMKPPAAGSVRAVTPSIHHRTFNSKGRQGEWEVK